MCVDPAISAVVLLLLLLQTCVDTVDIPCRSLEDVARGASYSAREGDTAVRDLVLWS